MRLDHLLSKDRYLCGGGFLAVCLSGPCGSGPAGVLALAEGRVTVLSCTVVRGGWLPGVWCRKHARCGGLLRPCGCGGLLVVGALARALVRVGVACCRGSGAVRPGCLTRVLLPCLWVVGCGCGWVGCELYSGREHLTVRFLRQNCFLFCSCVFVVCFFERSVDALASGADEGRGGLRYSSGSRLAGCDPRVSEWGDPARVMSCHLHLNCIGCGG